MEFDLSTLVHIILHLDQYLNQWAASMGSWLYLAMFLVVFCETGLVVTPFLPGDSLLFALGALTSTEGSVISLPLLLATLTIAPLCGDLTNYTIGKYLGPKVFNKESSLIFNKNHLVKTQSFYDQYGVKTIIIARFIPIVRTFAPFVAGIGKMKFKKFATFSVVGAVLWVWSFLFAGHLFGDLPVIKKNFHTVVLAIIVISVMPAVIEFWRERQKK